MKLCFLLITALSDFQISFAGTLAAHQTHHLWPCCWELWIWHIDGRCHTSWLWQRMNWWEWHLGRAKQVSDANDKVIKPPCHRNMIRCFNCSCLILFELRWLFRADASQVTTETLGELCEAALLKTLPKPRSLESTEVQSNDLCADYGQRVYKSV